MQIASQEHKTKKCFLVAVSEAGIKNSYVGTEVNSLCRVLIASQADATAASVIHTHRNICMLTSSVRCRAIYMVLIPILWLTNAHLKLAYSPEISTSQGKT